MSTKPFFTQMVFSEFDHPRPVVDFSKEESKVRLEFLDEADVNKLLKRYAVTGQFYDPLKLRPGRKPLFGDFTQYGDLQASQNALIAAHEAFDSLPVEIRERFNYDPVRLVSWLSDDRNREEAIKLGFIEKAAGAATPEPPEAAQAAPAAVETKDASASAGKE